MYLYSGMQFDRSKQDFMPVQFKTYINSIKIIIRKEKVSPLCLCYLKKIKQSTSAFFFASLPGTLTVEAAIIVPFFLFVMISIMQFGNVMGTAVRFGNSLAETSKIIAASAYVSRYGGDTDGVSEFAAGALSAAFAHGRVLSQAGNSPAVKNTNLALSSFLQEDETIDLIMTYQLRSPLSVVKLPGNFFIQCARVRAWTGRIPPEYGEKKEDEEAEGEYVYMTQTGSVYHEEPECTHLKLSIREVDSSALGMLRNNNGGIYHSCEKCGGLAQEGRVYITGEGEKYHSSLSCSGLKRTVRQVRKNDLSAKRACSKCGSA